MSPNKKFSLFEIILWQRKERGPSSLMSCGLVRGALSGVRKVKKGGRRVREEGGWGEGVKLGQRLLRPLQAARAGS